MEFPGQIVLDEQDEQDEQDEKRSTIQGAPSIARIRIFSQSQTRRMRFKRITYCPLRKSIGFAHSFIVYHDYLTTILLTAPGNLKMMMNRTDCKM